MALKEPDGARAGKINTGKEKKTNGGDNERCSFVLDWTCSENHLR